LRIFIDTANISEIKEIAELGFIDGVTTNPSLVARVKRDYFAVLQEICALVDGPISAEVLSTDYQGMMEEAQKFAGLHKNIVVKIPLTQDGLKAIKTLRDLKIRTNATLIFSANQALLAARAGASFVSPFIGRIDDTGNSGLRVLKDIVKIFSQYNLETEIIAASIRHPLHVTQAALIGAHIATVPYQVIKQMIKHPLTDIGIQKFKQDWENAKLG